MKALLGRRSIPALLCGAAIAAAATVSGIASSCGAEEGSRGNGDDRASFSDTSAPGGRDELYLRARDTLTRVQAEMRELRDRLNATLVGQEVSSSRRVSATDIDTWFNSATPFVSGLRNMDVSNALPTVHSALEQLEVDYDAQLTDQQSHEEFAGRTYKNIIENIGQLWRLHLYSVNNDSGEVATLVVSKSRLESKLWDQWFAPGADRDVLRVTQEEERRAFFEASLSRYRGIVKNLTDFRSRWGKEVWLWQNFAVSQNRDAGDAHAAAAASFTDFAYGAFGYRPANEQDPEQNTAIKWFLGLPGSTDRLYLGSSYNDYTWCVARTYADIQVDASSCSFWKMDSLARIPVDQLGERAPLKTDFSTTAPGGRPEYVPGGRVPPAPASPSP
jgi:hypothetical protein